MEKIRISTSEFDFDTFETYSRNFDSVVNKNLSWVHTNPFVLPVLSLFLGVYAALARPKLPSYIVQLFENTIFRLILISYIVYRGNQDPEVSILIAAGFLITMHMINKQRVNLLTIKSKVKNIVKPVGKIVANKKSSVRSNKNKVTGKVVPVAKSVSGKVVPVAKSVSGNVVSNSGSTFGSTI